MKRKILIWIIVIVLIILGFLILSVLGISGYVVKSCERVWGLVWGLV